MFGTLTTLIINLLMKKNLVNLLFEEFKLFELANKLSAIGIDVDDRDHKVVGINLNPNNEEG